MIGAIIGDIAGSRFEFKNYRHKDFELFAPESRVTDDSVMTLAIAKALMKAEKTDGVSTEMDDYYELAEKYAVQYMRSIGRRYPSIGYGGMFYQWLFSPSPKPYNSYGNGAAMRVSAVGFLAKTESCAIKLSEAVTKVTHNHPEGIKGAEATVVAIYMAKNGSTKKEIRKRIASEYYSLDFTIDGIRTGYTFNETCQDTVPQAVVAFLESVSFEDAIRTAVSVGGDSDTLAAITGAIAEAYYGVPEKLKERALSYLDPELLSIYREWADFSAVRL